MIQRLIKWFQRPFGYDLGFLYHVTQELLTIPLGFRHKLRLDFGEIILTGIQLKEVIDPVRGKEFIISGQLGRSVSVIFESVTLNNFQWASWSNGQLGNLLFSPEVKTEDNIVINSGTTLSRP